MYHFDIAELRPLTLNLFPPEVNGILEIQARRSVYSSSAPAASIDAAAEELELQLGSRSSDSKM